MAFLAGRSRTFVSRQDRTKPHCILGSAVPARRFGLRSCEVSPLRANWALKNLSRPIFAGVPDTQEVPNILKEILDNRNGRCIIPHIG
jgi:hypothetical protein